MATFIDDFKRPAKAIKVRPESKLVPYGFRFPIASSEHSNDGVIPYGARITTAAVTARDTDGTAANDLVGASSVHANGDKVTVGLTYPSAGAGTYHLKFVLTLSTGAVRRFDFVRVVAVA